MDNFVYNYNACLAARDDNADYAVFSDLPDNSLYCIWYLLSDGYADAINILDEYMYSHASELYQKKIDVINSLMFENVAFDAETGTLSINLDTYQQQGVVTELDGVKLEGSVYKITPYYQGKRIKSVIVNGAYATRNTAGQIINTLISPFSIKIDKDWIGDLDIILNNVGAVIAGNNGFIDLSEAPNAKVNLEYRGSNIIQASASGAPGLSIQDLTVVSKASTDTLLILAVNGANGEKGYDVTMAKEDCSKVAGNGGNGANGGCAIISNKVTLDSAGTITLIGGNGGNGGNSISIIVFKILISQKQLGKRDKEEERLMPT